MDRVARQPGGEPSQDASGPPRVAADEDLHHFRRVALEAGDLEVIDLPAVVSFTIDELVIEDTESDVDVCGLAHP
jgi:hypothetical protein